MHLIIGTQYEIEVNIEKPSDDQKLNSLKVDGKELITSTNITGPYELSVPYETEEIKLYAETSHEKASIKVGTQIVTNIFNNDIELKVGINHIVVDIVAEDGTPNQYIIEITRAAESPKLDTLEVNGHDLRNSLGQKVAFDPDTLEYQVIVPYTVKEVEIIATSTKGTVHGTGVKGVNVGSNNLGVQVVADNGMSTQYKVTVIRLKESYTDSSAEYIKIAEIKKLDEEFHPLITTGYAYTVPNNVKNLTVSVHLQFEDDNVNDDLAASYKVFGDKNLHVGLNNVVVIVTSADGTSQTTYVIQVTREPKQYEVNNKNEAVKAYTLTQNKDQNGNEVPNEYTVDIGDNKTSDVDFAKFIENLNPENQDLEIEVLTDILSNPDEVVVRVTDGDETEFVKFTVKSTGNPTGFQGEEWTFLLLLGVILIVLLAILFTVNKDKYGKITKKTNRRNEKREKREDAKRK